MSLSPPEPTGPAAERPPSVRAALFVLIFAVPATLCLGLPVSLVAFGFATDFTGDLADLTDTERWVGALSALEYVNLLVLPGQALLLCLALGAAVLSREPLRRSLGLVRPRVSWALVPLFALVALFLNSVGSLLAGLFFESESTHLQEIARVILEPRGLAAVYVLLCLSIPPGVAEELLYRGYVQQRLQRRWPAPLAILVPGLFFALAHVDPMHVLGVLPVGLWLGFVAWGTGSVLPSIVCHVCYNAGLMLLARAVGAEGLESETEVAAASGAPPLALLCVCLGALCVSVPVLLRAGLRRP